MKREHDSRIAAARHTLRSLSPSSLELRRWPAQLAVVRQYFIENLRKAWVEISECMRMHSIAIARVIKKAGRDVSRGVEQGGYRQPLLLLSGA